jgi:hypothetical protein
MQTKVTRPKYLSQLLCWNLGLDKLYSDANIFDMNQILELTALLVPMPQAEFRNYIFHT